MSNVLSENAIGELVYLVVQHESGLSTLSDLCIQLVDNAELPNGLQLSTIVDDLYSFVWIDSDLIHIHEIYGGGFSND